VATPSAARVERVAEQRLGIDALRGEQEDAIRAAASGRDVLVLMPTGSGKSAIYQLTGELRPGPTIVVSPLIALQRDQLDSIAASCLDAGAALNSQLGAREYAATLDAFAAGRLEFLFVAPEQLAKRDVLARLREGRPSLFVVDEAHCISSWGHDFRPDYLQLGPAARELGRPPILALTATAAPPVRAEILERLDMRDALVVAGGFDRPEIELAVATFHHSQPKRDALVSDVVHARGTGIVYVATRRNAERVGADLSARGVATAVYHAGLARRLRDGVHAAFHEGSVRVVVATNAFGMGIDKPDVRFVFHHDVPGSLDAYFQEIGRAGRDGDHALAKLYYDPDDLGLQRFFKGGELGRERLRKIVDAIDGPDGSMAPTALCRAAGLGLQRTAIALDLLDHAGAVERDRRGRVRLLATVSIDEAVELAASLEAEHRRVEQSRLEMMRGYAETAHCRRVLLLGYYGERYDPPCNTCDNDRLEPRTSGLAATPGVPDHDAPFAVGAHVQHRAWGPGEVMIVDGDRLVVLFEREGYRTLDASLVAARAILIAVPESA
jgi:ATP-dependent DNA helicase RecQ